MKNCMRSETYQLFFWLLLIVYWPLYSILKLLFQILTAPASWTQSNKLRFLGSFWTLSWCKNISKECLASLSMKWKRIKQGLISSVQDSCHSHSYIHPKGKKFFNSCPNPWTHLEHTLLQHGHAGYYQCCARTNVTTANGFHFGVQRLGHRTSTLHFLPVHRRLNQGEERNLLTHHTTAKQSCTWETSNPNAKPSVNSKQN